MKTARDLKTLLLDRETTETLRSALDALNELKPTSPAWAAKIRENREELLDEMRAMESQGSLF